MRGCHVLLFPLLAWLVLHAPAARAYDPFAPEAPFHPSHLTVDELRFLQAVLAYTNHYNGLLDGDWGPASQRALEQAFHKGDRAGAPTNLYVSVLAYVGEAAFIEKGWKIEAFNAYGLSMLVPFETIELGGESELFFNLEDTSSSLRYSLTSGDVAFTQQFHDYAWEKSDQPIAPYSLRRDGLAVTSVTLTDGHTLYTRSDLIGERWSTVIITAAPEDAGPLAMVTASISSGRWRPLGLPSGGLLRQGVRDVAAVAARDDDDARSDTVAPVAAPPAQRGASGTGFVVDGQGHILTNAHVVAACTEITIDGQPVQKVALDAATDLAVLLAPHLSGSPHTRFDAMPARLNSDVTVAGFPLTGLLGGLNITRGAVSSDRGMGGDMTRMQITAPIQPGNSGGPVFSERGTVVGVVVSRLTAEDASDIPQNVNFAIRGEIARLFLSQNGVHPALGAGEEPMPPEDLASLASQVTRLVLCD